MFLAKFFILLFISVLTMGASANSVGITTYPLILQKHIFSAEFNGVMSEGGGFGLQGRYTRLLNERTIMDGGFGLSAGDRSNTIFLGTAYELFADYQKQPRVTIRGQWESANEYDSHYNIITFTPIVSKGFVMGGKNFFPHIALPYSINLNSRNASYKTTIATTMGISGNIPVEGYQHLIGTLEARFSLNNSYSGLFAGISFPVDIIR